MTYKISGKTRQLSPKQKQSSERLHAARTLLTSKRVSLRKEIEEELIQRLGAFEEAVLDAVKECVDSGMSKAAIMRAYGTTDYRTIKNYIDRLEDKQSIFESIAPARFKFSHVDSRGDIVIEDIETGENDQRIYIGDWKNDWEHNIYGVRFGKKWESIPELERLVAEIESGSFVSASEIDKIERRTRARVGGAAKAEAPSEDNISDDWDM